jgi:hypothetical protein
MSIVSIGSWHRVIELPNPLGPTLFGANPLRHSHTGHRQKQQVAERQFRDDYSRIFGRTLIESLDAAADCDSSPYEEYTDALGFLLADGLSRGTVILSDQHNDNGDFFLCVDVVTWPGVVVAFQKHEPLGFSCPLWCYWNDFCTHRAGFPNWRDALTARARHYAEGPRLLLPCPEHTVRCNYGKARRTNIRFANPEACGFARGYFDINTCPRWNRPTWERNSRE